MGKYAGGRVGPSDMNNVSAVVGLGCARFGLCQENRYPAQASEFFPLIT